jgi:uncharacterized phage protein (TIGR02220 family)
MARPYKNGLDYFPMSVHEDSDMQVALLVARYGTDGLALLHRLYQKIHGKWYFLKYDEDKITVIADRLNLDSKRAMEIVEFMVSKDFFNEYLFRKHSILTNEEIQYDWLRGIEKRARINIVQEYWLINEHDVFEGQKLEKIKYCEPPKNNVSTGKLPEETPQIRLDKIRKKNLKTHKGKTENGGEAPPYPPLCVDNESGDMKEEKEIPKPKLGKQARKQAEKHRINQQAIEIIDYLNQKTGKKYRHSKAHLTVISARLNEGFSPDDCKRVIDTKTAQWLNDEKEKYLRPETLFRPSKFEGYLNEKPPGTFPQKERIVNHMTVSTDFTAEKRIMEMQSRRQQQAQQKNSNAAC